MVIEKSGACITGGTVTVIEGQASGKWQVQVTPCDVWGYGGGFTFNGLTPGVSLTLRASASGYATQDVVVIPQTSQSTVFEILLTPVQ